MFDMRGQNVDNQFNINRKPMTIEEIFQIGHQLIGEYTQEILRAEQDIKETYARGMHTNVDSARERIKLFEARRGAITRFLSLITE